MLTAKQLRFCEEYIVNLNATEAAIRAGYSKRSATVIGHENLTKPDIKAKIEDLLLEKRINSKVTEDQILEELKSLGFYSIKTFIDSDNAIVKLNTLTTEQLRPVVGIKSKESFTTIDNKVVREVTTELKLADKRSALVDLGRHLGIFDKDNKQKAIKIKVTRK